MTRTDLIDRAETILVRAVLWLFRLLGPVRASNLGGWIGRGLGPRLPSHQVVRANLKRAFPDLSQSERDRIGRAAWDNIGRVMGEYVHLPAIVAACEEIDLHHIAATFASPKPAILYSAHCANWEICIPKGTRIGGVMAGVYRAPQRPGVDAILAGLRRRAAGIDFPLFPKGAKGGREAFAHMRAGGKLALLMDQKLNEGIPIPFFGHPAMTAQAAAKFALLLKCPVVPSHIERLGPARYRMIAEPPLPLPDTGSKERDVELLTEAMTRKIEQWVRARPGEWLWMHRRWPRE